MSDDSQDALAYWKLVIWNQVQPGWPQRGRLGLYLIRDQRIEPTDDVVEWGEWYTRANRIIDRTQVHDLVVSTIFTGIDFDLLRVGPPLLFETMVFQESTNAPYTQIRALVQGPFRYSSLEAAAAGHSELVRLIEQHFTPKIGGGTNDIRPE